MFGQARAQQHRAIPGAVATLGVNERVAFMRKTYIHLVGAVFALAGLEYLLLSSWSPLYNLITRPFMNLIYSSQMVWLGVLGAFMGVSWLADKWARSDTSIGTQYAGLGLYVIAESIILIPMLMIANLKHPGAIAGAGLATVFVFAGLTATVFLTKKDFSFMGGILKIAGFGAMGLIVCSLLFGFQLGNLFSFAMVLFAGGYILYQTSQIAAHWRPTQHVAASLALFSSVALLFWYILRIFMSRD